MVNHREFELLQRFVNHTASNAKFLSLFGAILHGLLGEGAMATKVCPAPSYFGGSGRHVNIVGVSGEIVKRGRSLVGHVVLAVPGFTTVENEYPGQYLTADDVYFDLGSYETSLVRASPMTEAELAHPVLPLPQMQVG